jgi:hypothetical protein
MRNIFHDFAIDHLASISLGQNRLKGLGAAYFRNTHSPKPPGERCFGWSYPSDGGPIFLGKGQDGQSGFRLGITTETSNFASATVSCIRGGRGFHAGMDPAIRNSFAVRSTTRSGGAVTHAITTKLSRTERDIRLVYASLERLDRGHGIRAWNSGSQLPKALTPR